MFLHLGLARVYNQRNTSKHTLFHVNIYHKCIKIPFEKTDITLYDWSIASNRIMGNMERMQGVTWL